MTRASTSPDGSEFRVYDVVATLKIALRARSTVVEHAHGYDRLFMAWGGQIICWQDTAPGDDACTAAIRELTVASVEPSSAAALAVRPDRARRKGSPGT